MRPKSIPAATELPTLPHPDGARPRSDWNYFGLTCQIRMNNTISSSLVQAKCRFGESPASQESQGIRGELSAAKPSAELRTRGLCPEHAAQDMPARYEYL